jgi:hypothetical protein
VDIAGLACAVSREGSPLSFYYKIGGKSMAKRELLIIALFGAAGFMAYQLLTPPSTDSGPGLSWSGWLERARSGGRGAAVASVTREGTIPLPAGVSTLRISGISAVVILGETRENVTYHLTVESNAPDEARARASAEGVRLAEDVVGSILALTVEAPADTRLAGALTILVPARLAAIVDGARSTDVSGVAGVTLDRVVGDARLREIAGAVTGGHRNGDLTVSGAATVALNLLETRAVFTGIRDRLRLTVRNGETQLDGNAASVEIDGTGHTTRLAGSAGPVRIFGMGGEIHLSHPRAAVHIDVRRAPVSVALDAAIPVTVFTSERRVRVAIAPEVVVDIDARTTEPGAIDAADLGVSPEITAAGTRVRLMHAHAPAIAIRNRRGAIEITQAK